MKQTIPFTKDITFKTKIGEITAISLDNDLMLKGEDLISGNFYISGNYKMLETSTIEESYSYKIPCEIAISDDYDTFDATVDIDDFYYEIIDDEILRINIVLSIDNLKKKEEMSTVGADEDTELLDTRCYEEDFDENDEESDASKGMKRIEIKEVDTISNNDKTASFLKVKEMAKEQNDTYLTYKVYIFKEGDSLDKITEKYGVTKDELSDYNNLEDLTIGTKLVIPSSND